MEELDITGKITGTRGNLLVKPKVRLQVVLTLNDGVFQILFKDLGTQEVRGPVIMVASPWSSYVNPLTGLTIEELEKKTEEVLFQLNPELTHVFVLIAIGNTSDKYLQYAQAICWDKAAPTKQEYINPDWLEARNKPEPPILYAKVVWETNKQKQVEAAARLEQG